MNATEAQTAVIKACSHEPKNCQTSCGMCCNACWNASVAAYKVARKKQLAEFKASLPKCEVPGCGKPGNWIVAGGVRMCGYCKGKAKRKHAKIAGRLGVFGLLMTNDRESVISLAKGE